MNQYTRSSELEDTNRLKELNNIPEYAYRAWKAQRDSAKKRNIPFRIGLVQWHRWWVYELTRLGPEAKRGRRRNEYVMARYEDKGAYELGNVHAVKPQGNAQDRTEDARVAAAERMIATKIKRGQPAGNHLRVRGDGHPKSKAVVTQDGTRYGSIALASEAAGITRQGGHFRVKCGMWTLA